MLLDTHESPITGLLYGSDDAVHYTLPNGWRVSVNETTLVTQRTIAMLVDEIDSVLARLADFELEHDCSCTLTSVTLGSVVYPVSRVQP